MRKTHSPKTQGFLGKVNPPRVRRDLRRGRKAQPMDSRLTILPFDKSFDRWSDAESYARRVMEIPVQSSRPEKEANPFLFKAES